MRVILLPEARRDLGAIQRYIAEENPPASERTGERIAQAIERLAKFPEMGRPGRVAGTRELVVSGTPYILPYRVINDRVEILAVYHGAQKWPDEL